MKKYTGVCKWFNPKKGFGFITRDDNNEDIFVHQTAIYARGFRSLNEGEKVEFNVEENNGKSIAVNVTSENGNYVSGVQAFQQRRFVNVENIEKNLKTAEEDLSYWEKKEFNREKIRKRYEQLKVEWDRNEIMRMKPDDRLTLELKKSIDYWKSKLENSRKYEFNEDENKEITSN